MTVGSSLSAGTAAYLYIVDIGSAVIIRLENNRENSGSGNRPSWIHSEGIRVGSLVRPCRPWIRRISIGIESDESRSPTRRVPSVKRILTGIFGDDYGRNKSSPR